MRSRSQRAVVAGALLLGLGAIAGLGIAARERIQTWWICHRLGSCAEAERKPLLERIVLEGRVHAVPALFELIGRGEFRLEAKPTYAPPYELHLTNGERELVDALIEVIGADCGAARALVLPQLESQSCAVRLYALQCLTALGVADEDMAGAVGARLDDREEIVRSWAVAALEMAGAHGVRYLTRAAERGDAWIQRRVLEALFELGPLAWEASGLLRTLAGSENAEIRVDAKLALMSVEGNRQRPAAMLTFFGDKGSLSLSEAILVCVDQFEESSLAHEEFAVSQLVIVGEDVIPVLGGALHHPRACVRRDAIEVVRRFGLYTPQALAMAKDAARDADCIVSRRAREALAAAGY